MERWQEVGEFGKNCTKLHNILQLKKGKETEANKMRETGIEGYMYGKREV